MRNINIDNINEFINIESYFLKKRDNNLVLSDYQIDILRKCGINYEIYSNIKSLLYDILNYLDETDDYELEIVSKQIDEYIYYSEYKK